MPTIEWNDLTPAERRLLVCASKGNGINLCAEFPDESGRIIRPQVFRDLCLERYKGYTVDPGVVGVLGAVFADELSLICLDLSFGLCFIRCTFHKGLDLHSSSLRQLEMLGCTMDGTLRAASVIVAGSICLTSSEHDGKAIPFAAHGEVDFSGARVGGQLGCEGAQLMNPDGWSLMAQGIRVEESVFLRAGFCAHGDVSFAGARIGGGIDCTDGSFESPRRHCFFAQDAIVSRAVQLSGGFRAAGPVDFCGAKIGGQFVCDGGKFNDRGCDCLLLQGLEVAQDVMLTNGCSVAGLVDLTGARIGRELMCDPGGGSRPEISGMKLSSLHTTTLNLSSDMLRNDKGGKRISLSGLTYDFIEGGLESDTKLLARWIELADGGEYRPQPYEQATKVLRAQGHIDAARDVAIAKRRRQRVAYSGKAAWVRKLVEMVTLDWTIAYGYQTWRVLVFSLFVVLWAGWSFGRPDGGVFQPVAGNARDTYAAPQYAFCPYVYALDVFLPALDLQQERQWAPDSSRPKGDSRWVAVRLITTSGWVLTTLLVAAFTGIIKKD